MAKILTAGAPLVRARAAVVLLHGRGGSAEDILTLAGEIGRDDTTYLAPQAENRSWYPYSFLAPLAQNEPHLSNALATVDGLIGELERQGMAAERVALVGFSQGGCLALEYAARHARRYGGIAGLSAGVIGPPGGRREDIGSLAGTPVFLGCSDIDAHVPLTRVHETREVMMRLGASVTERIYPGMGHTINEDEIANVRALVARLGQGAAAS
jgi:predicted esterase